MLGENQEVVKTGVWVGDCFIYTNSVNRLNYYVGGEIVTISHLDRWVIYVLWITCLFKLSSFLAYLISHFLINILHPRRTMYLLGYIPKDNRLYLCDKDLNIVSFSCLVAVLEYQTAVMRSDFESADKILPTIPKDQRTRVAHFLEKQVRLP